jgi:hypothetical protein
VAVVVVALILVVVALTQAELAAQALSLFVMLERSAVRVEQSLQAAGTLFIHSHLAVHIHLNF